MSCQHGCNEIDIIRISDDEEYVEETDTGDKPLRDSKPMQIGRRSKSHMHEAHDEEAENANRLRLRREGQTAQRLAANAENTHSRHLGQEDQADKRSAADAEHIALSRRRRREDQSVRRSEALIKKASPAPPIVIRVT
jgi:hypothetical protein